MNPALLSLVPGLDPALEAFTRRVYLPLVGRRKELHYEEAQAEAQRNQRASAEALAALSFTKLKKILRHADENVPFYRERFAAAGVRPSEIQSLEDFRRIPPLTKREMGDAGERLFSPRVDGTYAQGVTSGSTGVALRFRVSSRHEGWIEAAMDRGHRWWGIERHDKRLILWGRPVAGGRRAQLNAWVRYRLRNSLHFNTFEELTDEYLAEIADAFEAFRPKLVYGYGSSLGALAAYMDRAGRSLPPKARPLLVEYTGDHIYEAERLVAERVFGAPVVSMYGSSEGGSLAYSCRERNLHVSVDHLFVEFLKDDGSPAAPGEQGEVTITTLNNDAMPLVRYRIGDLGSAREGQCPCGVTLPLMNLEVGKMADRITTSSRSLVSSYVLDYISKHLLRTGVLGIQQFQVEQVGTDDFILHIVKGEPFDPRVTTFFTEKMTEYLGESIRTEVRFTDAIQASASGKRRWFKKSIP